MAVDNKSDYVGNNGGAYTDIDGMSRQFTYIDHDKKPTIHTSSDKVDPSFFKEYRISLIERIHAIPPSICPEIFQDFIVRTPTAMEWNSDMILDAGVPLTRLRDLAVILENVVELRGINLRS